jgi:hypothetical protein
VTQDLNTEIKIGADASRVETGVAGAKKALASLGQAADQVGRTGGEGLKKIGAGGEDSARRLDSATKNMVASLQRQIAAAEAGGTANRQYQESIARLRGADVNALKPYLDQLDAARDKAEKAARANAGLEGSMGSLSGAASLARSALTAMVGSITIGAFVGFVRGINDGIDALNDIKDATGSSIENISALEDVAKRTGHSMDSVTSTLVKFNQVLSEAKPGSAQELALKAIGLSAKELRDLDPAEALLKTAQALTEFEDDANKARLVQELFGKSIREVMPFLNDLAEKGKLVATVSTEQADEAAKFNKQLSEMEANAQEAARALVGPMVTSLNTLIAKFKEGREAGRSFWSIQSENYWNWVSDFYGGSDKPAPAPFVPSGPGGGAGRGSVNPALPRPSVGNVPDANALKAAADAAKKAAEERKKELQEQAKLMAELSGLTSSFAEDWNRLTAIYQAGGMSLAQYTKAQADLLAKQPAMKAATDAENKSREEALKIAQAAADARRKEADGITAWIQAQEAAANQALQSINARITSMRDEEEAVSIATTLNISLAEAVERVAIARLQEKQAGFYEGSEGYEALQKEIDARKELATLIAGKATREANEKAAKDAAAEWQRTAEKIEDSITDALLRGFESGKGFAENLRNTLRNMFNTLVLRPIISAVMSPVSMAITGVMNSMGMGAASSMGTSLLGNIGSSALISGLGSSIAGAVGSSLGAIFGTGVGNVALGTTLGLGASSSTAAALAAAQAGGAATGGIASAGSLFSGIGAAMPWIAGIAALASILGGLDDSGTYHTGGAARYSKDDGLSSGQDATDYNIGFGRVEKGADTVSAMGRLARGLAESLDGVATSFGRTAGFEIATAFADDSSKDGAWGAFRISLDGKELLNWENDRQSKWAPREFADGEEGYRQYLEAIAKDTRQVLLDMDLPSWADDLLNDLGETPAMDELTGIIAQINALQSTFDTLGKSLTGFSAYSDEARYALVELSGGLDAFRNNASTYYSNFYSPEEQRANLARQIKESLGKVNVDMPDFTVDNAREQYRKLIEAQDANTEEGRKAIAMLLEMAGAFSQLAQVGDTIKATRGSLQDRLDALQGNDRAILDRQRKAEYDAIVKLDPALAALITQIYELEDAARVAASRGSLQDRLDALQGNDRAILERKRKAEYDALMKLDPALAALVLQIYALEDAAQAAADAEANRVAAIDRAYTNLQAAYARERKLLESQLSSLGDSRAFIEQQQALQQESLALITGVFNLVRSNARDLYGDVQSSAAMQAAQGQAFILQALQAAQSTGYLPDQDQLSEAISAARAGITDGAYATQFQRDRDTLVLAGRLSGLEAISGKQKTAAEMQLEALQAQLDSIDDQTEAINLQIELQEEALDRYQEQIDIANNVYDATLSIADAIAALNAALTGSKQPTGGGAGGSGSGSGGGGAVFGGGGGSKPAQDPARYFRLVYGGTAGVGYEAIRDQSLIDKLDKLSPVYHSFDGTGDLAGLHAAFKSAGGSIPLLSILSGNYESDWVKAFASVGLPAFAGGGMHSGGLRMVGERGWEIEATGPARYWNQQQLGSALAGGGGAVAEELQKLRSEVALLRQQAGKTAESTSALAEQFDRVTGGGNAMRQKAIA